MDSCKNGKLFDLYVYTVLKNSRREPVGWTWTLRTNGHCLTDLEMARGLMQDLNRMGIRWQIRDWTGKVVEESSVEVDAKEMMR